MNARLRTPLARARGLGSAQSGSHHWWVQRLTAIVLMLTVPWFLWFAFAVAGSGQLEARLLLAQPWHASAMLIFVGALFWHAQLGVQVVIEDYVHTHWLEITLQILVKLACLAGFVASAVAIGRIVFGA